MDTQHLFRQAIREAHDLLEREFTEQLEGTYGIRRDGGIAREAGAHLDARERRGREKVVAAVRHHQAPGIPGSEAVQAYLLEAGFAFLIRLVALKLLEARAFVPECVSRGELSAGFRESTGLAPGRDAPADGGPGYRRYLEGLFDEIDREAGGLFDRSDPASSLWPRPAALQELLQILNRKELAGVWREDETIIRLYRHLTGDGEQRKRRDSELPRIGGEQSARGPAVNPRDGERFLADHTLGRTWYEMRQGRTRLAEQCAGIVRPDEVFLAESMTRSDDAGTTTRAIRAAARWLAGEPVPEPEALPLAHAVNAFRTLSGDQRGVNRWAAERLERLEREGPAAFSTAELLNLLFLIFRKARFVGGLREKYGARIDSLRGEVRRRVEAARQQDGDEQARLRAPCIIAYRAPKDPRDLKVRDPACGTGPFLLHCFDLLLAIYEEHWEHAEETMLRMRDEELEDEELEDAEAGGVGPGEAEPAWEWDPGPPFSETGETLRREYRTLDELRRALPGLILRHNLHGTDADARRAGIAALALWMRAQRAFHDFGIPRAERPAIRTMNIAAAEPAPGRRGLPDPT